MPERPLNSTVGAGRRLRCPRLTLRLRLPLRLWLRLRVTLPSLDCPVSRRGERDRAGWRALTSIPGTWGSM
jgi:hypothetical protein